MRIRIALVSGAAAVHLANPAAAPRVFAQNVVAQNVVRITATDYVFTAPDTVPAGLTILEIHNAGKEAHEAILRRVPPGSDIHAAITAVLQGDPAPTWVNPAGGPNVVDRGVTARTMQYLTPGTYYWMCFLGAADGMTHVEKGMVRVMVVRPSRARAAREPATASTIHLSDHTFDVVKPLQRGTQWIRVENTGHAPHELVLFRMAPGRTLADLKAWQKEQKGPQPYIRIGGVASILPGAHALMQMDGAPGTYVLRCRVRDAVSGRTHAQLGMEKEVVIR